MFVNFDNGEKGLRGDAFHDDSVIVVSQLKSSRVPPENRNTACCCISFLLFAFHITGMKN
jgi:hypothetical protein